MDAVTLGDGPQKGDTVMDIGFSNINPVIFFSRRSILTQEYMGLDENGNDNVVFSLDKSCDEGNTGPDSIDHRYITEDIPVGCKIYHDLGIRYGVATPIIDAMITLGGALHRENYLQSLRYDLNYLGIDDLSEEQLKDYLYNGEI